MRPSRPSDSQATSDPVRAGPLRDGRLDDAVLGDAVAQGEGPVRRGDELVEDHAAEQQDRADDDDGPADGAGRALADPPVEQVGDPPVEPPEATGQPRPATTKTTAATTGTTSSDRALSGGASISSRIRACQYRPNTVAAT